MPSGKKRTWFYSSNLTSCHSIPHQLLSLKPDSHHRVSFEFVSANRGRERLVNIQHFFSASLLFSLKWGKTISVVIVRIKNDKNIKTHSVWGSGTFTGAEYQMQSIHWSTLSFRYFCCLILSFFEKQFPLCSFSLLSFRLIWASWSIYSTIPAIDRCLAAIFWWWLRHWSGDLDLRWRLSILLTCDSLRFSRLASRRWPFERRNSLYFRFSLRVQQDLRYLFHFVYIFLL